MPFLRRFLRPEAVMLVVLAAGSLAGCTALLGIDENYYLDAAGGASNSSNTVGVGAAGGNKPNGIPCLDATECNSGNCADSVCCNEVCDGPCMGCTMALGAPEDGTCTPIAALTDPGMECRDDQTCDGAGKCFLCGIKPTPPPMSCPAECTGGCSADTCTFACDVTSCQGADLVCPPGFKCLVNCTADDACRDATIACPDTYECLAVCNGGRACDGTQMTCTTGVCQMDCQGGAQVCSGASMTCGTEACLATCGSNSQPNLDCNQACHCAGC